MYNWIFGPPPPPEKKTIFTIVPCRIWVAAMVFMACFVNYMMRVNISVNIIAMVPPTTTETTTAAAGILREEKQFFEAIVMNDTKTGNCTVVFNRAMLRQAPETPGQGGTVNQNTFTWTTMEQAHVISAYFWGYTASSLFGGPVAEYFGPRVVVMITTILSGIGTGLNPPFAKLGFGWLVACRVAVGFFGGFLFPALHHIVVHWAPPEEKGRFVSALLGGAIGTVFTWSASGPLIDSFGWESAFYAAAVITLVWCLFWWLLVWNSPTQHPHISRSEKKYILDAIGDRVRHGDEKMVAPFCYILTSLPFLAMLILQYGSLWGLYFIMTAAPKYMSTVLNFTLTKSGILASLPYLGRMFASIVFGAIGDKITKGNYMSTTAIRKTFVLFSHIIPGLLLLALGWTTDPYICVVLITLSLSFNGAAVLTNLVNHQDLAPNYAGTLYGLASGVGNSAGFLTPPVTAYFTESGNTINEWRPVFIVGATIYIGAAIYFIIFGTAKTQKWNYPELIAKKKGTA